MSKQKLTESQKLISEIRYILYEYRTGNSSKTDALYKVESIINIFALKNK